MKLDLFYKGHRIGIAFQSVKIFNRIYKRDELGRFARINAVKDKKTIDKKRKSARIKSVRKKVFLQREEFARVQSAFMSDVTNEDRKKRKISKIVGDYRYTGVLRDDGTRDIIRKEKI